jgi:thymidylate synthase (FAD)
MLAYWSARHAETRVPHKSRSPCTIGKNKKNLFRHQKPLRMWYALNMIELLESKVLNSGSVELRDSMADDLSVVNAARVSFSEHKDVLDEADEKLINFLMRERHGTPFEHSVFKFYIKCPIFVAREWMRHRISSFNEMSMRYYVPEELFFYTPKEEDIRRQVGKPGHYEFKDLNDNIKDSVLAEMTATYDAAYESYQNLLDMGLAKEVARSVLPVGQFTEFIWTVNARSLMNFISLRNDSNAQKEIREFAKEVEKMFGMMMPVTYECFVSNGRRSP